MTNKTAVRDIDPIEIEKFRKSLSNESTTLMPNDEGYEEALVRWSESSIAKAGLIVNVFSLEDIVATVNFARKHGCDFAVCNGGHTAFSSSNGGIVLDMRKRNKVQVDTEQKLVNVQAGAIWRDVYNAAWEHGFAVVGGSVDNIGVGGLTLAGGIGLLTRKCDDINRFCLLCHKT
jgi:FAD/FMN-containing dehydrogenase